MPDADASTRCARDGETPAPKGVWLVGMDDDLLDLLAVTMSHARIAATRFHLAEAEARLAIDQPRLVIVDLGSPVGPHVRLVHVLRRRAVPLVIVTSRDSEVDGLAKPFSPIRLLGLIYQIVAG